MVVPTNLLASVVEVTSLPMYAMLEVRHDASNVAWLALAEIGVTVYPQPCISVLFAVSCVVSEAEFTTTNRIVPTAPCASRAGGMASIAMTAMVLMSLFIQRLGAGTVRIIAGIGTHPGADKPKRRDPPKPAPARSLIAGPHRYARAHDRP